MTLEITTQQATIKRALIDIVGRGTGIQQGTSQIDTVTVDLAQNNVTYTVTINTVSIIFLSDADATIAEIRDGLIAAADASDAFSAIVTNAANGSDAIDFTAVVLGGKLTTTVTDDGTGSGLSFAVSQAAVSSRIAWGNQDFERVINTDDTEAFATIGIINDGVDFGLDEIKRDFDVGTNMQSERTEGIRRMTVSINTFTFPFNSLDTPDAIDRLRNFLTFIHTREALNITSTANVSIIDNNGIRDISELLGEQWETRGVVDIVLLYVVGTLETDSDFVETVEPIAQSDSTLVVG